MPVILIMCRKNTISMLRNKYLIGMVMILRNKMNATF